MEEMRQQLEATQAELHRTKCDLVTACARLKGTEVLARSFEDLRREYDILLGQLEKYEDAILSVENRLEGIAHLHGGENTPAINFAPPVAFSSLLEENQRLHSTIEMFEMQRVPGLNFGNVSEERAALEERIEELQAENDILRDDLNQAQNAARLARSTDNADVAALQDRLERSERAVSTKSQLCEVLGSEVQKLSFQLRRRDESSRSTTGHQQPIVCSGIQCQHQAQVEQLNQLTAQQRQEIDNLNQHRQEDNKNFARMREELERRFTQQVSERQSQMQAELQAHIHGLKEQQSTEKEELLSKNRSMQISIAQLNEQHHQLKRQYNQTSIQVNQAQLKLRQITDDRDNLLSTVKRLREKEQQQSTEITELTVSRNDLRVENSQLKSNTSVPLRFSAGMSITGRGDIHGRDMGAHGGGSDIRARGIGTNLAPRVPITAGAHTDGPDSDKHMSFVKEPLAPPSGGQGSSSASMERVCPVCKQRLNMDLRTFYEHCDRCADTHGSS